MLSIAEMDALRTLVPHGACGEDWGAVVGPLPKLWRRRGLIGWIERKRTPDTVLPMTICLGLCGEMRRNLICVMDDHLRYITAADIMASKSRNNRRQPSPCKPK